TGPTARTPAARRVAAPADRRRRHHVRGRRRPRGAGHELRARPQRARGAGVTAVLRSRSGSTVPLPVTRWIEDPAADEELVLERAISPVLDVGCGPGRHVVALGRRGIMALGVDVSPHAVDLARRRGAPVLRRSIFDRLPGANRWGSALLLDGNIGIGGSPVTLLMRIASLLRPGGRVLAELAGPGTATAVMDVRVETDDARGP